MLYTPFKFSTCLLVFNQVPPQREYLSMHGVGILIPLTIPQVLPPLVNSSL